MNAATRVAPAETTILVHEGAFIPNVVTTYTHGDKVTPDRLANATLRDIAAVRTASGKVSAEAKKAVAELARRKANRAARKATKG